MNSLIKWVAGAVDRGIEPWRMHRRMRRLQDPRPSRDALVECWRAVRHASKIAPSRSISAPFGPHQLHGHNAADLLDVFYEIFISEAYQITLTGDRPYVIDCGANVGVASLYFKIHYPNCQLVAFEPNPSCAQMWQRNVAGNGFTGAELIDAAVGTQEGTLDLFLADDRTLGSSTVHKPDHASKATRVKVVPLSRWIDRVVDVLKLDVEGAELTVLEELSASGALAKVRRLMIKYTTALAAGPASWHVSSASSSGMASPTRSSAPIVGGTSTIAGSAS